MDCLLNSLGSDQLVECLVFGLPARQDDDIQVRQNTKNEKPNTW